MRLLTLLMALSLLVGCVSPAPYGNTRSDSQSIARLYALLARGQFETVRKEVAELSAPDLPDDLRARLHLADARALAGLKHTGSAMLAFGRAQAAVAEPGSPLDRDILRFWGDAELAAGRVRPAARRYEEAFASAPDGSPEADELSLSVAVALDAAGSPMADSWRRRIRRPRSSKLRDLESRLVASAGSQPIGAPSTIARPTPVGSRSSPSANLLPGLRSRAQWGAAGIRGDYDTMAPIWRITVHHGATRFTSTSEAGAAAEMRNMQRFHQQDRRWADISYHFCIDPAGRIWEGRSLAYQGAHAGNPELNRGNIGVMLLGNFNEQALPAAQQQALAQTLSLLSSRYSVQRGHLYTHNEVKPGQTECPGRSLQTWMDRYRGGSLAMASRQ